MPRRGYKHTPEAIAKMREAKIRNPTRYWLGKTRVMSADWRAHIGAGNRGQTRSLEMRARISAALTGKPRAPETAVKIRAALADPAVRAKFSGPNPRKRRAPEHYERIAVTNRGKPVRWPNHRFYYKGEAFRSTWEVRVAKALDALGVRWEYEARRFNLGSQTYAPDFYLPDGDCYWEVKGYLGPKSRRTIQLFRSLRAEPLIVVDRAGMVALEQAAYAA